MHNINSAVASYGSRYHCRTSLQPFKIFVARHVFLVLIISSYDKLWGLPRKMFTLLASQVSTDTVCTVPCICQIAKGSSDLAACAGAGTHWSSCNLHPPIELGSAQLNVKHPAQTLLTKNLPPGRIWRQSSFFLRY